MSIPKLPPLPSQTVPIVDQNGRVGRDWYNFLVALVNRFSLVLTMIGTGSTTVSALPSAASAGAGARAFVTDANSTTFHATAAGGGSNKVPVVSDGTNWLIG